ncbi:MAG: hypothetical protein ACP5PL_00470 [Infirmifilum sp.]
MVWESARVGPQREEKIRPLGAKHNPQGGNPGARPSDAGCGKTTSHFYKAEYSVDALMCGLLGAKIWGGYVYLHFPTSMARRI